MNCNQIEELLPEMAIGGGKDGIEGATPEAREHVASCGKCTARLREFQKTMALLDEWQAPDPSPYFDTRLQARLREEMARPKAGWLSWVRPPAWAVVLTAALFLGVVGLGVGINYKSYFVETESMATRPPSPGLPVQPGSAVGDLQALDRNNELYADFDVLDEVQVQDDVTATP